MPTTTPAIAPRGNFECVEPSTGATCVVFPELVEKVEDVEAVELLPIEAADEAGVVRAVGDVERLREEE